MNSATNVQPSPKRTRFAPKGNDGTPPVSTSEPPKALAESLIRAAISSLHPTIATIAERLGKEHILILSRVDHKILQVKRMKDDAEFIPKSARINFDLSMSKRASANQDYVNLTETTKQLIIEFQLKLKDHVAKAQTIEITIIKSELHEHLAKCTRVLTQAFMILNKDRSDVDQKVYKLLQKYLVELSIHAPITLEDFCKIYKNIHGIETFPPTPANQPAVAAAAATTTSRFFAPSTTLVVREDEEIMQDDDPVVVTTVKSDVDKVFDMMEKIFVSAWTKYKNQQQKNDVDIELKKLSTTYFVDKATINAVDAVDTEPGADKIELKALIRSEAKSDNKEIRKQLDEVKKELKALQSLKSASPAAKNINQRGRGGASKQQPNRPAPTRPSSTSSKKKSSKATKPTNQNSRGNGKAAGANNGNGNGKQGSKKKTGREQSDRNRSRSRSGKSTNTRK